MPKRSRAYEAGLRERLKHAEYAAGYLNAALEESGEAFLAALGDVAESRQMSRVARAANLNREGLYRMLSETGNPRFSSFRSLLEALGLKLMIAVSTTRPS